MARINTETIAENHIYHYELLSVQSIEDVIEFINQVCDVEAIDIRQMYLGEEEVVSIEELKSQLLTSDKTVMSLLISYEDKVFSLGINLNSWVISLSFNVNDEIDMAFFEQTFNLNCEESDLDETQASKIEALQVSIDNLQRCFNNKIEYDAHKNKLFDNMHKELMTYKNGLIDKLIETLALDIIQLVDSTKNHASVYEDREYSQENYKGLLNIVNGIAEDLQDILYRQNIEPYSVEGEEVDVRRQKIIRTIETEDASKDNLIAERMVEGYEKEGKIIRPERIKIYKYPAKDSK